MNIEDLIGAKIIEIKEFDDDIQDIIVEKNNKHIKIVGTDEYPWISYYVDKCFCPNCETEIELTVNKEKHIPEYACSTCGYKE